MGQLSKSNDAAVMDALIYPSREECALGMGHRSNNAARKDVQTKLKMEEFAGSMGQRPNDAATIDVQTKSREKGSVKGTGHTNAHLPTRQINKAMK